MSYNRVTYEEVNWFAPEDDVAIDDWVPGAQVFTNIHLVDVEGVQVTEDLEEGWDYTNATVGLQFGWVFH